jgi:hypothetical protein
VYFNTGDDFVAGRMRAGEHAAKKTCQPPTGVCKAIF